MATKGTTMTDLAMPATDLLADEHFSPVTGNPLAFVDVRERADEATSAPIRIAIDREGAVPSLDAAAFDMAITVSPHAPAPWTWVVAERLEAAIERIRAVCARAPVAATVMSRLLRLGDSLSFDSGLDLESYAYSMLLGGGEFARWRAGQTAAVGSSGPADATVTYERDDDKVILSLATPSNRNAMTAAMRDALYEALVNVLEDPSRPNVVLRGQGRCFSTGGHIPEFGATTDLASAHVIRTQRSCARVLHLLGDRATVRLHGACIGSGIEVPAAAARRIATSTTFVQLPEIMMGLIPGAGGTVTMSRAIGRHRTTWLALTGQRMNARQGLEWGLFQAIE